MLLNISDENRHLKKAFPERKRIPLPAFIQKFLQRDRREVKAAQLPGCAPEPSGEDLNSNIDPTLA